MTTVAGFRRVIRKPEFDRDLKKLLKRYRSLEEDLETFVKVQLIIFHKYGMDNQGIVPISRLGLSSPKFFKAKKLACKALKGKGANSGLRVIYAYLPSEDQIELIEIYYKGDQENHDSERIGKIYGKMG